MFSCFCIGKNKNKADITESLEPQTHIVLNHDPLRQSTSNVFDQEFMTLSNISSNHSMHSMHSIYHTSHVSREYFVSFPSKIEARPRNISILPDPISEHLPRERISRFLERTSERPEGSERRERTEGERISHSVGLNDIRRASTNNRKSNRSNLFHSVSSLTPTSSDRVKRIVWDPESSIMKTSQSLFMNKNLKSK